MLFRAHDKTELRPYVRGVTIYKNPGEDWNFGTLCRSHLPPRLVDDFAASRRTRGFILHEFKPPWFFKEGPLHFDLNIRDGVGQKMPKLELNWSSSKNLSADENLKKKTAEPSIN